MEDLQAASSGIASRLIGRNCQAIQNLVFYHLTNDRQQLKSELLIG